MSHFHENHRLWRAESSVLRDDFIDFEGDRIIFRNVFGKIGHFFKQSGKEIDRWSSKNVRKATKWTRRKSRGAERFMRKRGKYISKFFRKNVRNIGKYGNRSSKKLKKFMRSKKGRASLRIAGRFLDPANVIPKSREDFRRKLNRIRRNSYQVNYNTAVRGRQVKRRFTRRTRSYPVYAKKTMYARFRHFDRRRRCRIANSRHKYNQPRRKWTDKHLRLSYQAGLRDARRSNWINKARKRRIPQRYKYRKVYRRRQKKRDRLSLNSNSRPLFSTARPKVSFTYTKT